MLETVRIALVGATGLVGRMILEEVRERPDVRVIAVTRREFELPEGARMEVYVAQPEEWGDVFRTIQPDSLVSALGTTMKKAGGDEEAFRAVDHQLVLDTARAAVDAGIERMVAVSSAMANPTAKNFYLRVKGEAERDLSRAGMKRLDILQPGLLKGRRENDMRLGEGLAQLASPITDLFLGGGLRRFRSIPASLVAQGALGLATRKAAGTFRHDNDGIRRAARDWAKRGELR